MRPKTAQTEPAQAKRERGRPSTLTPEIQESICDLIAIGEPTKRVEELLGYTQGQIWMWIARHPDFRDNYLRAKAVACIRESERITEIADEPVPPGDSAASQRQRTRVETRKWYVSKLAPKIFGDKQMVEVTGAIDLVAKLADARSRARLAAPYIDGDVVEAGSLPDGSDD